MSENNRRIVAKRVVKHMKIGSADSTIGNFKLDLIVSTSWLLNLPYLDIPFATRVFDKSFHVGRSLYYSRQVQLTAAIDLSTLTNGV
jgi:hypothetical protein